MKVGSKVVYRPVREYEQEWANLFFELGYILPSQDVTYTVIDVSVNKDGTYILLEEIRNPNAGKGESGYNSLFFREIFPTDGMSDIKSESIIEELEIITVKPQTVEI